MADSVIRSKRARRGRSASAYSDGREQANGREKLGSHDRDLRAREQHLGVWAFGVRREKTEKLRIGKRPRSCGSGKGRKQHTTGG
eukprot:1214607-Pleurochrysis_carterae.AAC.1